MAESVRPAKPGSRALRVDAQHSIDRILDAAIDCLARNPACSTSEIAQAAGVGRVTLYGHFPSREDLVEQALLRALERGEAQLAGVDLTQDVPTALRDLIRVSWQLTAQSSAVLAAAQAVIDPERIQQLHATPADRLTALIERGQREGTVRGDLPAQWLTSLCHHVLHGAATDVSAGRLSGEDAGGYISKTLLAALAPTTG